MDNYFTFELNRSGSGYVISALNKENLPSVVILPSQYQGKPVTNIKYNGFANCHTIIKLVIPQTVISIDSYLYSPIVGAFSGCSNLAIVEFEEGSLLHYIGSYAFYQCNSLTSIILPENINFIGHKAFFHNFNLKYVYLTSPVPPHLGYYSFFNPVIYVPFNRLCCYRNYSMWESFNLKPLPIPIPISYGYFRFQLNEDKKSYTIYDKYPDMLPSDIIMPSYYNDLPITKIGHDSFYCIPNISSIQFPKKLITIEDNVFRNFLSHFTPTNHTIQELHIPKSVESIGKFFFAYNWIATIDSLPTNKSSLEKVVFEEGSSLKYLGDSVFNCCTKLIDLCLPESLEYIGDTAFLYTSSLPIVNIPRNLVYIGVSTFCNSHSLTAIAADKDNAHFKNLNGILLSHDLTELVVFPANKILSKYTVPDIVTTINSYAFKFNHNLESIYLPEGVLSIGDVAFCSCFNLKNIYFSSTIKSIGVSIFSNSTKLEYINVSENNQHYTSINGILFAKDLTTIRAYPPNMKELTYTVPDSTTTIDTSAFNYAVNLKELIIGKGIQTIKSVSISYSESLESITILGQLSSIESFAIYSCINLKKIILNSTNPPKLGGYAIAGFGSSLKIYVPKESLDLYMNSSWKDYSDIIYPIE